MNQQQKLGKLREVFSPVSPIKKQDLFFGRINQLENVCDAINEQGQHAILYGERGVGKTSLGNIMVTQLTNVFPIKITCTRDDDFKSLWLRAFNAIPLSTTSKGIGFKAQEKTTYSALASQIMDLETLLPANIENILRPVLVNRILFIFDEFDNITKNRVREQFADLIKTLSDNCENVTIVIIGISDNVVNLIGNHQSLERCMKQIKMPRMQPAELASIIDNGILALNLEIVEKVRQKIIDFSTGFPHYTHLLCKYACKEAIKEDKNTVEEEHLETAIALSVENVQEQIKDAYRKATFSSSNESQWEQVLIACAISEADEYNCFTMKEITDNFSKISGKSRESVNISYNLGRLCGDERGLMLEKITIDGSVKYRFNNPLSKAYVILKMNTEKKK